MSIGFFIWLLIAIFVLGFLGWTIYIQIRQKSAWRAFAQKYKLNFSENKFMETPSFEGFLQDRYVRFYESKEPDRLGRPVSKITAEMDLKERPACLLIITARAQQDIFNLAQLPETVKVNEEGWDQTHLIGTDNELEARKYLSRLRLKKMNMLLTMKNATSFFIGRNDRCFLMIQMQQPFDDPKRIQALFKRLSNLAHVLETNTEPEVNGSSKEVVKETKAPKKEKPQPKKNKAKVSKSRKPEKEA